MAKNIDTFRKAEGFSAEADTRDTQRDLKAKDKHVVSGTRYWWEAALEIPDDTQRRLAA